MLFILLLIITQIQQTVTLETTRPVSIVLDGFTLESWNKQSIWNQTRTVIVQHLNTFCKKDFHCEAEYGIDNIHLLSVRQHGISSIYLDISADKPIVNHPSTATSYNYTALLTSAVFQAKIDIEHLYDNQLLTTTVFSINTTPAVLNRTNRLLFVLLGISIVTIVFALTIIFFQRIHQFSYSRLMKATRTDQPTQDELLNHSPSVSPVNP